MLADLLGLWADHGQKLVALLLKVVLGLERDLLAEMQEGMEDT